MLCNYPGGSVFHRRIMGNSRHRDCPPVARSKSVMSRFSISIQWLTQLRFVRKQQQFIAIYLPHRGGWNPKLRTFLFMGLLLLSPVLHLRLLPYKQMSHVCVPSHAYCARTHTLPPSSNFLTLQCIVLSLWCNTNTQLPTILSPRSNRTSIRRVERFDNKHFLIHRMPSCYSDQRCQRQQTNFPSKSLKIYVQ
jgi:hypothetical protein